MSSTLSTFLSGIHMATFAAAGLFFLKFWKGSRDQFFLLFGLACWLLSVERVFEIFASSDYNVRSPLYLFRIVAYGLMLWAIIRKNRAVD